jgi:hypothetical protein
MTWTDRSSKIAVGDTICFKTSHLFASGLMRTNLPHLSGKVTGIEGDLAQIEWHTPHDQTTVPLSQITRLPERGIIE